MSVRTTRRGAHPGRGSHAAVAQGEGLAPTGQRTDALRTFDETGSLLPPDSIDPALPFLFLADVHLARWRGNTLTRLGEPDTVERLSHALARLPASFMRARTAMLVDLAFAFAALGNRDAALDHARLARRLGSQIKSDRQLRRLGRLVLPGAARDTT
ncbi:hypothetical protein [Crossiella sp. CA198]|uniref:hypothetical protein n=1 Tax=Crossiella sp. CA198 TaxID=3455607 RepID=UPI003F8D0CEB